VEKPDLLETLARRFVQRLDFALDSMGYPSKRLDRARQLSSALGLDVSVANGFLSGHTIPDYVQLAAICALTDQTYGYYLDEVVAAPGQQATTVKPLGPGEDLAVKLPKDMLSARDAAHGLVYHRAKVSTLGFGIEAGDYLIAQSFELPPKPLPHRLYLFSGDDGFAVRRCVEVSGARAVFRDSREAVPHIVHCANASDADGGGFGQLVASLRGGNELHSHM
jgi:hypothetical protein